ncbi:hypothetical protein SAMN05216464_10194 [Mucilaginibacter pineti]|uniref:Uncharacterized protein n=1 Tax=Mucilaginibacter pineti TaxID=1391627 RepID=A0A1G6SXE3_9SPHI|nr:hypothetical protein SAMN05216464_10194 [Mucilaginibacter pineti]
MRTVMIQLKVKGKRRKVKGRLRRKVKGERLKVEETYAVEIVSLV